MSAPGRSRSGRHTLSSTARGLGYKHQVQTRRLIAALREGTPCWWCGHPMYRSQRLSGDHSVPRAHGGQVADRLLHLGCNSTRGDGSRDHQRPALQAVPERPAPAASSRRW